MEFDYKKWLPKTQKKILFVQQVVYVPAFWYAFSY